MSRVPRKKDEDLAGWGKRGKEISEVVFSKQYREKRVVELETPTTKDEFVSKERGGGSIQIIFQGKKRTDRIERRCKSKR